SPIRPLPKSRVRQMPVPAGCRRPEHQEDRNGPHKGAKAKHGLSRSGRFNKIETPPSQKHQSANTKPAENIDGFVSGLRPRSQARPFSL
ncbi:hypothetical protein, partial [Rhizobium sp. BR 315]|uniref:hypothetical protein n=1 Tax=Rhizobium sp. BR 315 TaxID=3040014 RepID=UPI003D3293C9